MPGERIERRCPDCGCPLLRSVSRPERVWCTLVDPKRSCNYSEPDQWLRKMSNRKRETQQME